MVNKKVCRIPIIAIDDLQMLTVRLPNGRTPPVPKDNHINNLGKVLLMTLLPVAIPTATSAQSTNPAPNTVTPPTLSPEQGSTSPGVILTPTKSLTAPVGSDQLLVTPGRVVVEGTFPQMASQIAVLTQSLEGQRVSLTEIYRVASEIEAVHARGGFVLARVSVPPQRIVDGGLVRLVVVDGFIERIDVSAMPHRVRSAVAARLAQLRNAPMLTLSEIERQLLIAGETAGVTLRSTLARGDKAGGVRLIVQGQWRPVSATLRTDNAVDRSLGDANTSLQVSSNGLLGLGETIYGYIASTDPLHSLASNTRVRVVGAGVLLGVGNGRLTLNPEATLSRTQPFQPPNVPRTLGRLERYTARAKYTLAHTRTHQSAIELSIEALDQRTTAFDFGVDLARDRYAALRLGAAYSKASATVNWSVAGQIGQGLGNLGLGFGVPGTRQGASPNFTKVSGQGHASIPVGRRFALSETVLAQTSFGLPLLRAEQFQLEGSEAVSVYVGGATAVDEGITVRSELTTRFGAGSVVIAPYVFAAGGIGHIARPTAVEEPRLRAGGIGIGARTSLLGGRVGLGLEYAYGLANLAVLDQRGRINFTGSVRF